MESKLERLKKLTDKIVSFEIIRKENKNRLKELFFELNIDEKVKIFDDLFDFKAMNLSGISLDDENFGKLQEKKYIQIIAIKKIDKKLKNINLRYFGRAEKIEEILKDKIVEFVLRWRLEKSFLQVEHYKKLVKRVDSDRR